MSVMEIDFGLELRKAHDEGYAEGLKDGVSHWISVQERLPDDDNGYLVWNGNQYDIATYWGDNEWILNSGESATDVTHYMPLPEGPKRGCNECRV